MAETDEPPPPGYEGATVLNKPDAQVPLDVQFSDEEGQPVRLGDFFKPDRPVLLMLVYFQCPYALQPDAQRRGRGGPPVELDARQGLRDRDDQLRPARRAGACQGEEGQLPEGVGQAEAAAGWHFLTSGEPAAARAVGDAIGFGYKLDAKGKLYLHQAAIYVCTPAGRVSRTIRGVRFESDMLRDSLIHASQGKISSGLFGFALSCGMVHFDPNTGKYTWAAQAIMQVTGILTVVILGAVIGRMVYREQRRKRQALRSPILA